MFAGTKTKTAYDRAKPLDRRAELMRRHERALIAARDGADVVDLTKRRAGND